MVISLIWHPKRGTDATGRVLYYENFFTHFLRVNDGRHFFQSGQQGHELFRIEGLNDMTTIKRSLKITADQYASNEVIRVHLVNDWKARMAAAAKKREIPVYEPMHRLGIKDVAVDGSIDEWGNFELMQPIDESYNFADPEPRMFFDAVRTKRGWLLPTVALTTPRAVQPCQKKYSQLVSPSISVTALNKKRIRLRVNRPVAPIRPP